MSENQTHGAQLIIDLAALRRNYHTLVQLSGRAAYAAVVKADAYGLGAGAIVPALAAEGCNTFFVAHPHEGEAVRKVAPDADIYVLGGLWHGQAQRYHASMLRPALGSLDEIREWQDYCRMSKSCGEAAIHVDTGINRLGLDMAEAAQLAERGMGDLGFTPTLLMSHFACADTPDHSMNAKQRQRFAAIRPLFNGVPASLANSAGIMMGEAVHYDMTRGGIALYGGRCRNGQPPLETVVRLEAPILQIRDCKAGDCVGYGSFWNAARTSRIALLSVGYADGFLRAASVQRGQHEPLCFIGTVPCPIVGRISMDMMAIDITGVPSATRGTMVEILGPNRGVDAAAAAAGTIGYEILTSLGSRYQRLYKEA